MVINKGKYGGLYLSRYNYDYPATITIALENPDDFVGLMMFVNGKWVEVDVTVNDDGTVTFVLDQPAVLSIASQVVSAA